MQMDEESHFSIGAAVAAGAACARVANMFTCPAVPEPGDVSTPESHDFQNSVFVAPEMQEAMRCTKANDIYAFGVLMWVLLTGRPVRLCAPLYLFLLLYLHQADVCLIASYGCMCTVLSREFRSPLALVA